MVRVLRGYDSRRVNDPFSHPRYRLISENDCVFSGATSTFHAGMFQGPLSMRIVEDELEDSSHCYTIEGHRFTMERSYLVLINQGQPYSTSIDGPKAVRSFAVYFSAATVADVASVLCEPSLSQLLDACGRTRRPGFYSGYYPLRGNLAHGVLALRRATYRQHFDGLEVDSLVQELLAQVFSVQCRLVDAADRIDAARPATRLELSRRIKRAKNFIDSEYTRNFGIAEVACYARLSAYHLQRSFRRMEGTSIQGYARARRMQRAVELLSNERMSIEEVAVAVGYAHHSSFTRAYVRHYRTPPRTGRP